MKNHLSLILLLSILFVQDLEANDSLRIIVNEKAKWSSFHRKVINSENGLPNNIVTDLYFTNNDVLWLSTQQGLVRYDGRSCVSFGKMQESFITSDRLWGFCKIEEELIVTAWGGKPFKINNEGIRPETKDSSLFEHYTVFDKGNFCESEIVPQRDRFFVNHLIREGKNSAYIIKDDHIEFANPDRRVIISTQAPLYPSESLFKLNGKAYYASQGYLIQLTHSKLDTVAYSKLFEDFNDKTHPLQSQIIWNLNRPDECYLVKDGHLYSLEMIGDYLSIKLILKGLPEEKYNCASYSKKFNTLFLGTTNSGLFQISEKSIIQHNSTSYCDIIFGHYALAEIQEDQVINAQGLIFTLDTVDCSMLFPDNIYPYQVHYDSYTDRAYIIKDDIGYYPFHSPDRSIQRLHPLNTLKYRSCVTSRYKGNLYFIFGKMGIFRLVDDKLESIYTYDHEDLGVIQNVLFSSENEVYLAYEFGLLKADLQNQKLSSIPDFKEQSVRALVKHEGHIWASTYGDGIYIIRPNDSIWNRIELEEYPQILTTHSIEFVGDKVYMSTNTGLYEFNTKDLYQSLDEPNNLVQGYSFQESDGLEYFEFNGGGSSSSLISSTGKIVYPTLKGTTWFQAEQFNPPPISTKFQLEWLKINGRDTVIGPTIKLDPSYSNLEVKFLNPYFGNSQNARVYYRVPELSLAWNEQNMEESFKFDRLPYGNYTIEVNVPGAEKADERIQSLFAFSVLPRFYETGLFYFLLFFGFLLLLAATILFQRKRALAQQRKLEAIIEARTKDLAKTNEELSDSLILRNKMMTIFSHDVRGPFRFLKELALTAKEKAEQKNYVDIQTELDLVYDSVNSSSSKADNLLAWIQKNLNEDEEEKLPLNISGIVQEILDNKKPEFSKHQLSIEFNPEDDYWALISPGDLEIILDNVLSNSLKYAQSKVNIDITKLHDESQIRLAVSDDGGGVEDLIKLQLLNSGRPVKSKVGKHGETGSGLGLFMIREMVINNEGEIHFYNIDQGFSVIMLFPAFEG